MAVITSVVSSRVFNINGEKGPQGTWLATCIDNKDQLGVVRQKYGSPGVMQTVDLTSFLFEFQDQKGKLYQIATREMRISSHEKSSLMVFLRSWLGHQPPVGMDSLSMIGQKAFITIDHQPGMKNPNEMYANIVSISPVPQGYSMVANGGQANSSLTTEQAQATTVAPQADAGPALTN